MLRGVGAERSLRLPLLYHAVACKISYLVINSHSLSLTINVTSCILAMEGEKANYDDYSVHAAWGLVGSCPMCNRPTPA